MKIHSPHIKALVIGLISALTLVSQAQARELTWAGAAGDIWISLGSATNWIDEQGAPSDFYDNAVANFERNTPIGNVEIVDDVTPQDIKVNNTGFLIFKGEGSIRGIGSLHKKGDGALKIYTDNSYSGGTTLEEGAIDLQIATGLGSGEIAMHNDTILIVADGLTVNNDIALKGSKIGITNTGASTFSGKISTDQSVVLDGGGLSFLTFTGSLEIADGHTLTLERGIYTIKDTSADLSALAIGSGATLALANGTYTMKNSTANLSALTIGSDATLKLESSTLTGLTISGPTTESFTTSEATTADSAIYTLSGIAGLIANATGSLTLDLGPLADFDISKGITGFEIEGLSALPSSLGYNNIILNINGSSYNVEGANAGLVGSTNIVLYIPEPSTATLSLLSLTGLVLRRRRKAA